MHFGSRLGVAGRAKVRSDLARASERKFSAPPSRITAQRIIIIRGEAREGTNEGRRKPQRQLAADETTKQLGACSASNLAIHPRQQKLLAIRHPG